MLLCFWDFLFSYKCQAKASIALLADLVSYHRDLFLTDLKGSLFGPHGPKNLMYRIQFFLQYQLTVVVASYKFRQPLRIHTHTYIHTCHTCLYLQKVAPKSACLSTLLNTRTKIDNNQETGCHKQFHLYCYDDKGH